MRLKDKVVIVTGAGSGFGAAMARRFAVEGAALALCDLNEASGIAVCDDIIASGAKAVFLRADVTNGPDFKALVDLALRSHGRLDTVVNNAGYTYRPGPSEKVPEESFDKVFNVNVKSIYWSTVHALPVFRNQGGGSFINIASTAGLRPRPYIAWYNGSKGAVVTLTKSLAGEYAPLKVRVNCLCPVAADTPMMTEFMGGPERDSPEARARSGASVPLGRLCQPEDVANAALYLASDEAEFITGVALEVDGGRCV
ncbi:MAG: glucose 1-dehydrogenase [Alphaproteobacteria bacterium]|nr:glucose 1-dehydrogenase [Alphaproteobacteria bacterium]